MSWVRASKLECQNHFLVKIAPKYPSSKNESAKICLIRLISSSFLLSAFLQNLFLCLDHVSGDVPPNLAKKCYVALRQALIRGLYVRNAHNFMSSSDIGISVLWMWPSDFDPSKPKLRGKSNLLTHSYFITYLFIKK